MSAARRKDAQQGGGQITPREKEALAHGERDQPWRGRIDQLVDPGQRIRFTEEALKITSEN